jgi:hypothetical protein
VLRDKVVRCLCAFLCAATGGTLDDIDLAGS